MLKGIYFLETNSSVLSDMEGCFTINDAFVYKGGCGVIREAVKQLEKMQDISFIVISDRLIDGTCEEALEQLSTISAQMIVATSTKDELMRTRLAKRAKLLPYPYSYEELDALLKKICGSSSYEDGEIEDIANSDISRDVDNPFSAGKNAEDTSEPESVIRKSSFQDRLKDVQLSKTSERAGRMMPQHTVVIYNQKGGVGKSTIAKELSIAMTCLSIQKGKELYRPKVCLCDLDLDSSDISSLLGLPLEPNIKQWSDDISKQYEKAKKRINLLGYKFVLSLPTNNYFDGYEYPLDKLVSNEKEAIHFSLSGHILDGYRNLYQEKTAIADIKIDQSYYDSYVSVLGIIKNIKQRTTKKGSQMAFLSLEDETGELEGVIFPKDFEKIKNNYLKFVNLPVIFDGKLQHENKDGEDKFSLIISSIKIIDSPTKVYIHNNSNINKEFVEKLSSNNGISEVIVVDTQRTKIRILPFKINLEKSKVILKEYNIDYIIV